MSHKYRGPAAAPFGKYEQSRHPGLRKTRALSALPLFPYTALDPNLKEIRVLEVAPGAADDMVSCTLTCISLLNHLVSFYETISYFWGPPGKTHIMRVNGSLISVPRSAEAAVKRMRFTDKPRVLWIDAICINQSSQSEKNEQVAFMSTIYSMGKQNLVYLGEDDSGLAKRAERAIQLLASRGWVKTDDLGSLNHSPHSREQQENNSNRITKPEIDLMALEGLFSSAWFTRLWVVQEVLLAWSNTCHWGKVQLDLDDVLNAAKWLTHEDVKYLPLSLVRSPGLICAVQMSEIVCEPLQRTAGGQLSVWMRNLQKFEKTEPRDSVFAVLGLMNMDTFSTYADAALLEVDYTKPLPDILRDATRYAMCQSGDMLALDIAEPCSDHLTTDEDFPSWAARTDLHRGPRNISLLPQFYQADEGLGSPNFLPDTTYGIDVLLAEGVVVDHITHATPLYPQRPSTTLEHRFTPDSFCAGLKSAKEMAVTYCGPAIEGSPVPNYTTMAFVITADTTKQWTRARPENMVELSNFLEHLDTAEDNTGSLRSSEKGALQHIDETVCFRNAFLRQFFLTSEGSMGLGPISLQADDLVVVLRGGIRPFILRKIGEFYKLMGAAYLHGIMDGEAVEASRARNEPEMLFPIR